MVNMKDKDDEKETKPAEDGMEDGNKFPNAEGTPSASRNKNPGSEETTPPKPPKIGDALKTMERIPKKEKFKRN